MARELGGADATAVRGRARGGDGERSDAVSGFAESGRASDADVARILPENGDRTVDARSRLKPPSSLKAPSVPAGRHGVIGTVGSTGADADAASAKLVAEAEARSSAASAPSPLPHLLHLPNRNV